MEEADRQEGRWVRASTRRRESRRIVTDSLFLDSSTYSTNETVRKDRMADGPTEHADREGNERPQGHIQTEVDRLKDGCVHKGGVGRTAGPQKGTHRKIRIGEDRDGQTHKEEDRHVQRGRRGQTWTDTHQDVACKNTDNTNTDRRDKSWT
ncbi:hypothetical protein V3C99_013050 [Haemonchus contortus]|uniref:Uncharacterized protein n=1 Tax=Haemonchus contortus TaxID=6289 RepID=A0A7I4Y2K7_HAECO